ncbi:MAG TPA: PspC domain-containing protein, partial [Chitinophagaceae bacterium]|nr:PspC domain-containing protein [Chitinophagaceae bacterium]
FNFNKPINKTEMKKVININFQGRVVPIEETSYDLLKQYTDSLRIYFANEEGRDEIINDIESRIGELFQERIKNGATCITDDDVNGIINNIGRPQDLADADNATGSSSYAKTEQSEGTYQQTAFVTGKRLYRDANNKILGGVCSGIAAYFNIEPIIVRLVFIFSGIGFFAYILLWAFVPSSNSVQNGVRKRLYRNPDNKIIAGVCSGIASYFNINVWIPRILFLIPFISIFFGWGHYGPFSFPHFFHFSFSPGTLLIYIILWLVIPEANTTSEKLEMKGERVDLNSIKNSVKEEMKGVKERISVVGKEGAEFGKKMGEEFTHAAKRTRTSLGDIIVVLLKIFLYFLLAVFAFMSFAFAIAATGIFPFKNYLLNDGWQNVLAWGTLLFMIYVPVIGIITWIIRRVAKIRSNSRMMRWGFFILWMVGIICFISLIVSVSKDFRSLNNVNEEKVALVNPADSLLEVSYNTTGRYNRFRMEPFGSILDDTAFVENVSVRVVKSLTDSFQVTVTKFVNGRTRHYADTLAALMNYSVVQKDSASPLLIDRGIPITEQDKFRNQRVVVTISVPIGKRILINKRVNSGNWEHFQFPWTENGDYYDWETESFPWYNHQGEELIMQQDGLYTLDGKPVSEWGDHKKLRFRNVGPGKRIIIEDGDEDSSSPGYRYERSIDSLRIVKEKEVKRVKDSLQQKKEELEKKLEKLDQSPSADAINRQKFDFIMSI